jgi:hypothetical protein
VLAEHSKPNTQALFTSETILTSSTRQSRVENDLGTHVYGVDSATHRVHDSCPVGASDVRQTDRDARYAAENEKIEMIERRRLEAHPNLSRARFRLRAISVDQFFRSTVLLEVQRLHEHLRFADIVTSSDMGEEPWA